MDGERQALARQRARLGPGVVRLQDEIRLLWESRTELEAEIVQDVRAYRRVVARHLGSYRWWHRALVYLTAAIESRIRRR